MINNIVVASLETILKYREKEQKEWALRWEGMPRIKKERLLSAIQILLKRK